MSTSILIVKGSPRRAGNSSRLADQAAAGAAAAGAAVESIFLHELDIQPCAACESCHNSEDGACIIEDDMQALYPKIRAADAILFASPVYWFTYSAQTKLFIDRCYALFDRSHVLGKKRYAFILTYGDSDLFTSGGINAVRSFQDMCRFLGAEIVGFVYGSAMDAGEIGKNEDALRQSYRLGERLAVKR